MVDSNWTSFVFNVAGGIFVLLLEYIVVIPLGNNTVIQKRRILAAIVMTLSLFVPLVIIQQTILILIAAIGKSQP